MSTISASTTTTTAYSVTADTTGTLVLQTGASPTTAVTIDGSQNTTVAGNLTLSGTGKRITGDFSNATVSSRALLQTSTTNGGTYVTALPNGTGTSSGFFAYNNSDYANSSCLWSWVNGSTDVQIRSGIAGTGTYLPMTFYTGGSERMRIDTSGNLLVGQQSLMTSATSNTVQILAAGSAQDPALNAQQIVASSNAYNATAQSGISFWNKYTSGGAYAGMGGISVAKENTTDGNYASYFAAYTRPNGGAVTERMRIDSSGNLLVGTTDAGLTSGAGLKFSPGTTPYMGIVGASSTNANTGYHLYSTGAAAYRFYVGYGGTVFATSTTISAISDIRFKENVRDLDAGLAEVMALKPRLYDWKEGKGADIKNARGFIAQEFEEVFPDLIDEWRDPAPEGEEPYKSVRQDLIPVLVKAIQEQQAIIETLTNRIQALENK